MPNLSLIEVIFPLHSWYILPKIRWEDRSQKSNLKDGSPGSSYLTKLGCLGTNTSPFLAISSVAIGLALLRHMLGPHPIHKNSL